MSEYPRLGIDAPHEHGRQEVRIALADYEPIAAQYPELDPVRTWETVQAAHLAALEDRPREEPSWEEIVFWTTEDAYRRLKDAVGFDPVFTIGIGAMHSGPYEYEVIYRMAIWVARTFGGMIDLLQEIGPRHLWGEGERHLRPPQEEQARREALRAYLARYPGRALAVQQWLYLDDNIIRHVVDAGFLEAWVQELLARRAEQKSEQ